MAIFALVLFGVWFVLAFGLRTVLQLRRTGDTGWRSRGLPGDVGSVEWWAALLLVLALLMGLAAPLADLAEIAPLLDSDALDVAGVAVAVGGIALTFAAQVSMGDSWRIGVDHNERTELVTAGAFRIVRNPIFAAMLVTSFGLALMVPNLLALASVVVLVLALELHVRQVEEPYLRRVQGDSYREYAARVGRFLPGIGRL